MRRAGMYLYTIEIQTLGRVTSVSTYIIEIQSEILRRQKQRLGSIVPSAITDNDFTQGTALAHVEREDKSTYIQPTHNCTLQIDFLLKSLSDLFFFIFMLLIFYANILLKFCFFFRTKDTPKPRVSLHCISLYLFQIKTMTRATLNKRTDCAVGVLG